MSSNPCAVERSLSENNPATGVGRGGVRSFPRRNVIPRAFLSNAPEPLSVRRGVLLRGALGEGGNPSFVLANVPPRANEQRITKASLIKKWQMALSFLS